jgi:hypothetical protein
MGIVIKRSIGLVSHFISLPNILLITITLRQLLQKIGTGLSENVTSHS